MKVCVIASGSKANVTYIETKNHKILIDMGKNKTYIVNALKSIGVSPKEIDLILISHLHNDHISALESFIKTYGTTVCMPLKMFNTLDSIKDYPHMLIYDGELIKYDDLVIHAIKSSHDAVDSRNFIIEEGDTSIVQITDTGYIKSKYFKLLQNRDMYLLESNHDIELLTHGPYPDWLKRRILSDEGHLSNQSAGFYLSKLIGDKTKKVLLMHLSETNNNPKIALKTVKESLKENAISFNDIECASQDVISEVINI